MGIRYDVLMTLPPGGDGQRTRLALQQGDDGIVRPAVLRMLMEGVTPFTATAGGDVLGLIDVVQLYDGKWGVFELVPGATLRELSEVHAVAKRLPAVGLSGRVVVDAAKAIGALHRESTPIAHGGISDAALLAGFDGTTSVLDLGAPRSSRMMAPEQTRGSPATPATDVFCLGAALHAALTGYQGPYASVANAGLDTLPWGLAPGVESVLREALHPAPNMRWPDGIAFAEQLESVLAQELIDKDALSQVIKTLFKDRQTALREAVEKGNAAPPPGPRLRAQMVPRSSRDLPIVSAVVEAAPPAPAPPPRPSAKNINLSWPEPLPGEGDEQDLKTEIGPATRPQPDPTTDRGTAPAGENPATVSLRGVKRSSGEKPAPPPRPSMSRPPRSSPAKAPPAQVVKIEENPSLGEVDDAPTGADHGAIIDESDLSHVPEPPEPSDGEGFEPGATTPGYKLKQPVPKDFEPTGPPRRLSTGLQLKMQSEEEKEAARGQEKISTADLDPDERDDGLGGDVDGVGLGDEVLDQPTNIRKRPKLTSDSMDALPVEPGIDDVQGDPTEPPKRMPEPKESVGDLEAAGLKKKGGGAARAVIALLLLAIAGGSGYVVLMRPDLVAKVKARIAVLRGQPPPVQEEPPPLDLDAGEAPVELDAGEVPVVVAPAAGELDAGTVAVADPDAGAVSDADAGEDDDGGVEEDEPATPPAKDAGVTKDDKKPKKVKKKRRR